MSTATLPTATSELAEEILAGWLADTPLDGLDSPAGPLFSSGDYTEYEITMTGGGTTRCSLCTGSIQGTLHISCC